MTGVSPTHIEVELQIRVAPSDFIHSGNSFAAKRGAAQIGVKYDPSSINHRAQAGIFELAQLKMN